MKLETLARPLHAHPLLAELEPDHVEFLAGCTKNVRFDEGDYVFREGDAADQLYLVRDGKISLEMNVPQRGPVVVETIDAGDGIGWSAISPPYLWPMDARTTRPTAIFAVDAQCLRRKLDGDHDFGYAFTRLMLKVVHQRLDRMRLQVLDVYRAED